MKIPGLILAILSFLPAPALACSCQWQGPFSWLTDDADFVVLAEVLSHKGNSMDLVVTDAIKGKEFNEIIRVWGEYQQYCRANVQQFAPGSRWVFALHRIKRVPAGGFNPSTPNISYGRVNDYSLSPCGAYWLREKNGTVTGNITSVFEWDYNPDMDPVPYDVIHDFVNGKAGYADIIEHSNEITSERALIRRSRELLGRPLSRE